MENNHTRIINSDKKKLLDGTISALLLSTGLLALVYGYNIGYNSFYGIPLNFTTPSVIGIVPKADLLYILAWVIFLAIIISLAMMWFIRLSPFDVFNRDKPNDKLISMIFIMVVMSLGLIITIVISICNKDKIMLFIASVYFLCDVVLLFVYRSAKKKLTGYQTKDKKNVEGNSSDDTIKKSTLKGFRVALVAVGCALIFCIVFLITYFYGSKEASEQEVYYFAEPDYILVTVYNDYGLIVRVYKPEGQQSYCVGADYKFIPLDQLSFYIVRSGTMQSPYGLSYFFNKVDELDS